MNTQIANKQPLENAMSKQMERPRYEAPRIKAVSEQEILNTFQITQSMAGWWATM